MKDDAFRARYGPWALVAGASVGLGAEFATQLARRGLNLVLVARRTGPLEELARTLRADHPIEVRTVALDLGSKDASSVLREETSDVEVGLLIYNAALSAIGRFLEQDLETKLRILDVNCRAPLVLAHELGRPMAERRRGGILLMSSLAGFQGSPYISTYAATKAFNLVLGEGLWHELREQGVDVLAFCAGATRTPGFEETPARDTGMLSAPVMEPEPTVAEALSALGSGPSAVAGRTNRLLHFIMGRLMPRRTAVTTMGRATKAMYLE
jgi:short-subunit dehydrogenase